MARLLSKALDPRASYTQDDKEDMIRALRNGDDLKIMKNRQEFTLYAAPFEGALITVDSA
ncbi:hypothetical protein [Puia dinghuensis]|uniref:Uncharacterized protein n=1 Tax=Puia dinghuensis TaxID=1792502 RepID=A0A8J2UB76_9BACT|nr:hypothetical protein [Puia dinghuensis]GGA93178.1 hypothetical protein GCM10011511_15740 [Puia dinghuensis]